MKIRQYVREFLRPKKIAVLMYHRISEPRADPWQLAVSPANFEAQLQVLKKKYEIITPRQLFQQLQKIQLYLFLPQVSVFVL